MPELFAPLAIKGLHFLNRIMIPPMASRISTDNGLPTEDTYKYYLPLAESGAGLALVEHHAVKAEGRARLKQLLIDREEVIPYQKKLVEVFISRQMPVFLQINHAGALIQDKDLLKDGWIPKGPSRVQHPMCNLEIIPEEFPLEEISLIPSFFADAALRGLKAGYSGIEIHAAHGYLLGQFLSPWTNRRSDAYGGKLENRAKLIFEVYESVRNTVGEEFPLALRLGMADTLPNTKPSGQTIEESIWVAQELCSMGVDLLDLSGNMCGYQGHGEGWFAPYCHTIREAIKEAARKVPIACTGGVRTKEKAQDLLNNGCCDLVGVGRALREDPCLIRSW